MEGNRQEPFYYTVGTEIELFFKGEWIRGRVTDGYRFRDGIITMVTRDGKTVWCPEGRPELYREPGTKKGGKDGKLRAENNRCGK